MMRDPEGRVVYLGVPPVTRTVADVLGAAGQLDIKKCMLLSEMDDGSLLFIATEYTLAEANWLLDRTKHLLHATETPQPKRAG